MKNVVLVLLAAGVVVFAALYILQRREAQEIQQQVVALENKLDQSRVEAGPGDVVMKWLKAEKAALKEERELLKAQVAKLQDRVEELEEKPPAEGGHVAMADETDTPVVEETADTEPKKAAAGGGMMGEMGEYMSEMMKNPEMRQMLRDNLEPQLNMMYGDLFKKLFLDEQQLARFKGLLIDMQMLDMEKVFGEDKEDTGIDLEREEITEELKQLLGDDRYRQYQDYQNNLSEMMALSQYKKRLTSKGVEPLADYQEVQLLAAIKEEKQKFQFATSFADPQNMDMTRFTQENIDKFFEERQELTRRIFQRSQQILTEEQFAEYKASTESLLKMEKMGFEMAVKMYGPKEEPAGEESEDTVPSQ